MKAPLAMLDSLRELIDYAAECGTRDEYDTLLRLLEKAARDMEATHPLMPANLTSAPNIIVSKSLGRAKSKPN